MVLFHPRQAHPLFLKQPAIDAAASKKRAVTAPRSARSTPSRLVHRYDTLEAVELPELRKRQLVTPSPLPHYAPCHVLRNVPRPSTAPGTSGGELSLQDLQDYVDQLMTKERDEAALYPSSQADKCRIPSSARRRKEAELQPTNLPRSDDGPLVNLPPAPLVRTFQAGEGACWEIMADVAMAKSLMCGKVEVDGKGGFGSRTSLTRGITGVVLVYFASCNPIFLCELDALRHARATVDTIPDTAVLGTLIVPQSDRYLQRQGLDPERIMPFPERVKLTRSIIQSAGDSTWLFVEPCMEGCLLGSKEPAIPLIATYAKGRIGGPLADTRVIEVILEDPVYSNGVFSFNQIRAGMAPTRPRPVDQWRASEAAAEGGGGHASSVPLQNRVVPPKHAYVGGLRSNGGAEGVAGVSPLNELGNATTVVVDVPKFSSCVDFLWAAVKEPTVGLHAQSLATMLGEKGLAELKSIQERKSELRLLGARHKAPRRQKNPFSKYSV
eukprot:TRINITY_DN26317_c0_g1_i1.p1 TRINITY_DN26317_c0_g1~~TRINITY_DN26317_c0_g1_i1.p1  ORF type:complete len:496 (+),score=85.91 TRINITY_DN26317_c0_g1_i1:103-1590(+)